MPLEWFNEWLAAHIKRHPFARLPRHNEEALPFYAEWKRAFTREKIYSRDIADAASRRLFDEPPPRAADHFVTLVRYAREAQAERDGQRPRHDLSTREGAEAASRGCDRCSGSGMVSVYHPDPCYEERRPESVSAYCVCAMGRWVKATHARQTPELVKRIPDLEDVLAGRSQWLEERPSLVMRTNGGTPS